MRVRLLFATLVASFLAGAFAVYTLLPWSMDKLPAARGYRFWAGVNYPWKSYQDFGINAWGHSGVSSSGVHDEIDTDFANIASTGIQVVKWRVFNDGRASPEFADDGSVLGYDEMFLKDIDAALEIAAQHNLYLVFGLFDSGFWTASCSREGVPLGGHADVITDPAKRQSLIDRAIIPLVEHVARSGRVVSYEVLAEPEWGITELHTEEDGRLTVPLADVQSFVRETTAAIHDHGGGLVTLESNRSSHMQYWQGLGLDYYSFSWYDWVQPFDPLDVSARSYALDRPVVLGEFPIQDSIYYDSPQILEIALGQGYAGAFAWSYGASDKYGSLQAVREEYAQWVQNHWQAADVSGGNLNLPRFPVPLVAQPFSYRNVQVALEGKDLNVELGVSVRDGGNFHVQFYVYPYSGNPGDPIADRTLSLQGGAEGTLRLKMPRVTGEEPYRLSMAIFDDQWTLRKWFDSMAIFQLQGGQITQPSLSDLDRENPCVKAR